MLLGILIATAGFVVGFTICHFQWKATYSNMYEASLKALKDQQTANNKAVYARVRAKIGEINRIIEAQFDIWGQIDRPDKGASHSKWKRELIGRVNDLEAEKMDTFKSILDEGVDLTVSVMESNGAKHNKKMSQIVEEYNASKLNTPFTPKTPTKTPTKNPHLTPVKTTNKNDPNKKLRLIKESKLSLVKGKNNDGQPK